MSALIAYRNWSDGVGSIPAWTFNYALGYPDSLQPIAQFPAENLRTRQLGHVARFELAGGGASTGPCAVELVASGAGFPVSLVAVIGAHLPDAVLYKPAGGSYVTVPIAGGYSPLLGIPQQGFAVIPAGTIVEQVQLYWNAIPGGDYFELGRVFISDALVMPAGVDGTWSLAVDDPGALDVSAGRQWYASPQARTRRLVAALSPLKTEEAFGLSAGGTVSSLYPVPSIQDLQMHAGATGEVIVIPRTAGVWAYRAGIYGHLERAPVIRHRAGPNYETELVVIEER